MLHVNKLYVNATPLHPPLSPAPQLSCFSVEVLVWTILLQVNLSPLLLYVCFGRLIKGITKVPSLTGLENLFIPFHLGKMLP